MARVVSIASWGGRILRLHTGEIYEVPDEEGKQAIIAGCLVVPGEGYRPPTKSDRWGVRDDVCEGEIVLRVPSALDDEGVPVVQYRAGARELADAWWRMGQVHEFSGAADSMRLLSRIAKHIEGTATEMPAEALETLRLALETAQRAWTSYRADLSGVVLAQPILLNAGQRLTVERHEGGYIPGPGPIMAAPLEVELAIHEKTEHGTREMPDDPDDLGDRINDMLFGEREPDAGE
jgi:hypothetical protein